MRPDILAIDFGTSNSAAAVLENGVPRRLSIQPGSDTLPTAVFGAELRRAAAAPLALAGLRAEEIGSVILVGG